MKKISNLILLSAIIALSFLSCEKTKTETVEKIVYDTTFLNDTLFLHDTITQNDTMFLIDSIIFYDTVIMIDTIIIHDTVIINDTSEFAYLFKHHELDTYDVLFYTRPKDKSTYEICRMNSDQIGYEVINNGFAAYPVWAEDGEHVYYIDYNMGGVVKKSVEETSLPGELVYSMTGNLSFLRHHEFLKLFLFSYKQNGNNAILAYDYINNTTIELTEPGEDETHPSCSKVDDWIYFSRETGETRDIFRKKIDGLTAELVYEDKDYNLGSFNVSADGKFLITPKFKDGAGVVVFYDIKRKRIIHELELPVEGHPMYASISDDNKAIFFVNGTPFNYSEPRNIYRLALDGTRLFQMTYFTDKLAGRPLAK